MDLILGLLISAITQFLKRFGIEKEGSLVAAFILALIVAAFQIGLKWLPGVYYQLILEYWGAAILIYEVILKRIGLFKKLGNVE